MSFQPSSPSLLQPPTYHRNARSMSTMASSSSSLISPSSGYVCDTIPPARIAHKVSSRSPSPIPPPTPPVTAFQAPITDSGLLSLDVKPSVAAARVASTSQIAPPPGRKLCVRHQRMADEGTNLKLQQVSIPSAISDSRAALGASGGGERIDSSRSCDHMNLDRRRGH